MMVILHAHTTISFLQRLVLVLSMGQLNEMHSFRLSFSQSGGIKKASSNFWLDQTGRSKKKKIPCFSVTYVRHVTVDLNYKSVIGWSRLGFIENSCLFRIFCQKKEENPWCRIWSSTWSAFKNTSFTLYTQSRPHPKCWQKASVYPYWLISARKSSEEACYLSTTIKSPTHLPVSPTTFTSTGKRNRGTAGQ